MTICWQLNDNYSFFINPCTNQTRLNKIQVIDPDYYEWETHIFFDDAFELGNNDEEEQVSDTNQLSL